MKGDCPRGEFSHYLARVDPSLGWQYSQSAHGDIPVKPERPSVHAPNVLFIINALEEVLIHHGHGFKLPVSGPGLAVGNVPVQ